jgi:superfamily II DNA or RNA helicase
VGEQIVTRWAGPVDEVGPRALRPLLADATAIRVVVDATSLDLRWLRWLPDSAAVEVALLDERGPEQPSALEAGSAITLLEHVNARSGGSGDAIAELVRRLLAGRARVTSTRPAVAGAAEGTIEVAHLGGTDVLLQQRATIEHRAVVRCHAFLHDRDGHHVELLQRELDTVFGTEPRGARSTELSAEPSGRYGGLRTYQRAAVEAWSLAGDRGILAMATGTGKTETALAALGEVSAPSLVTVVLAPFIHLVDQWVERYRSGGGRAIACHSSTGAWAPRAHEEVDLVRAGVRPRATLVATYATARLEAFRALVGELPPDRFLLVADEAHNLGSEPGADLLFTNAGRRLGLTATPERWDDPEGNERLQRYFGGVVFEYPLARAIADGVLTPYRYHVGGYELTPDELDTFRSASDEYRMLLSRGRGSDARAVEAARVKRSEALDGARGKLDALRGMLRANRPDRTIIYCADRGQLDAVLALSWNEGHQAHPFTGEEPAGERRRILDRFAAGDVPVLAAIRCLDEGVDVPEAREAYLLRSSGNPAQHIQRRGRLLRRSPGKDVAVIHDLVASNGPSDVRELEGARVREFAGVAANGEEALAQADQLLRSRT